MDWSLNRRETMQTLAALGGLALATAKSQANNLANANPQKAIRTGIVSGRMTGARAIAESLLAEGVGCVYGIPGAQENELWDELKSCGVPYLLSTHEYSAACMADGYARVTGKTGVVCVVPGPGVTNALTGLGEALLDSSPIVAIVGDVANGDKYRPFQVHSLNQVDLLKPVCKRVYPVTHARQIAATIRQAFRVAESGEPGPVAVVVPFQLLIEMAEFHAGPGEECGLPCDESAIEKAIALLSDRSQRIGIYAGLGCMDHSASLTAVAEMLQAPVSTSVSGKGCVNEMHPLAVGWGFGEHGSIVAEKAFKRDLLHPLKSSVSTLLAIGVKFSEVSTGFYGNPKVANTIHVDINKANLGQAYPANVCVHADAGLFLSRLLACKDRLARPCDDLLHQRIEKAKAEQARELISTPMQTCGIDPLAVVNVLRSTLPETALLFTDVSASEHLAAEYYTTKLPRSYFNPVDNQSMGWSLPAAIGAQKVSGHRTVAVMIGDGCLLMSMTELATAARDHLPVKVFVLDDHAYHYMQILQYAAYKRTTATLLPMLDYQALAKGFGVQYFEARSNDELKTAACAAIQHAGPALVRISTDYGDRKIRWIESVRGKFAKELSAAQKARFLARLGARGLTNASKNSD